ncbi:MAG: class I SAM-dependent methyltransferase, partial [Candidatus Rokubacteria bacterium]|nr:class I SAM-dependent methyltransferase [Candidatus Rokubacteria bacterium]
MGPGHRTAHEDEALRAGPGRIARQPLNDVAPIAGRPVDAGCGDGYWLVRLAEVPGVELTGVDYNPVRVERARTVAPGVPITCGEIADFRTDRPFDIVWLSQVLEHVEDDVRLLRTL